MAKRKSGGEDREVISTTNNSINFGNLTWLDHFVLDEDSVSAEAYLNRAGLLISNCKDLAMQLRFKSSQARVLDYKRQFIPAAGKYHELSCVGDMHESERLVW